MMNRSIVSFDYLLLFSTLALIIIGILFIYSSGINADGIQTSNEFLRQIIWASIGAALMVSAALIKYDYYRDFAPYVYGGFILLIIFTLLFGSVVNGARSWIGLGPFGIQPSEFMKIGVILLLAHYLDRQGLRKIQSLQGFLLSLFIVAIPMGLILMQPDLGTAMVYLPIALFILYAAGARPLYLLFIIGIIIFTVIFTILPEWERMIYSGSIGFFVIFNERLYIILVASALLISIFHRIGRVFYPQENLPVLHSVLFHDDSYRFYTFPWCQMVPEDFQMMRLIVFLDPNVDPRGAGWNIIQSITAVGSGGLAGMGYLQGTQSHYQYLPAQSTDFIFSILSEEWGFAGGLIISTLYGIIIVRGIVIATQARDRFGSYLAIGVIAMLFFHFAINVGMTIGLMPITGIPLLFLSYGGSSLWTAMIGMGMLMSVSHYKFKY
jgi:rod shape determining protein RodA